MSQKLFKYEFSPQQAEYLINAVNTQQIRGFEAAQNMLLILNVLKNPLNVADFEKEQLEKLKTKYNTETKENKN